MTTGFLWACSQRLGSLYAADTNKTFLFVFGQYDTNITGLLFFHINFDDNT